jgi:superfamily II DNA or RNA helicase
MNLEGVDFLSKVANRLADFVRSNNQITHIKIVLSNQFAPTKVERLEVLRRLILLPIMDVRIHTKGRFQHRKNYIFRTNDEIRVVVGSINVTSAGLFRNLEMATYSTHEINDPKAAEVVAHFEELWSDSEPMKSYMEVEEMSNDPALFSVGDNVKYISTGKVGTINKVIAGLRSYSYRVMIDGQIRTIAERFLELFVDTEENIIDQFAEGKLGNHNDFKLFHTWFRLARPLEGNLYSYLGSKTKFNPYQFKPLLRFLSPNSDERLFIADEVGVGKTIETGIILTELLARNRLDIRTPILVVCPYSLGPKWIKEMKKRFNLDFHLHDGKSLKFTLETTLQNGIFPNNYCFGVVGLQLIRGEEYLKLLRKLDANREISVFGMVVIDEVHHLRNPETDNNKLGHLLSNLTEMMLMLSATPLNLRNEDLYNQMNVLNPVAFPDPMAFETLQSPVTKLNKIRQLIAENDPEKKGEILLQLVELRKDPLGKIISSSPAVRDFVERLDRALPFTTEEVVKFERLFVSLSPLYQSFTRTRKREALQHQVQREVWELAINLSEAEMNFQRDVLKTIEDHYLAKGGDPRAISFITNTHRRMVSSCIPAMAKYLEWCVTENRLLESESSGSEETEDDSQLNTTPLDQDLKERFIDLLKQTVELEETDSKYEQFLLMVNKILKNPDTPQVIIFSFFVRTIKYLRRRLEDSGLTVGVIHGEVPLQSEPGEIGRYEIMEAFERGEYQVLLSSEVGGEGLDFQYCHAIVNYDLPYNPMRIEQRIGRIDRFGQEADKVIVANLFIQGTVDEEIYDRLYRRLRLVEDGVGAFEPILGKRLADIQTAIISGGLTSEQKEIMSQRLDEAIISAKTEMEEFDKHRNELISDDYLVQPINSISKQNFISPADATELTALCLSGWEGCRFLSTKGGCGDLVISEKVVNKIEHFLRRPGNERGYAELELLLSPKSVTKVVFDGSIAEENNDHLFLPPTGYWTRFLTNELISQGKISKVFGFTVDTFNADVPKGEYMVFLFEIRMEGIRREIEFLGIPVDTSNELIVQTQFETLPRMMTKVVGQTVRTPVPNVDVNLFLEKARNHLEEILEEKRSVISQENRYKVESRIAALTKSSETRIMGLQEQKSAHITNRLKESREPDIDYIRLTDARIEKEQSRLKSKIDDLRKHQELSVDYSLEAIVYLEVLN